MTSSCIRTSEIRRIFFLTLGQTHIISIKFRWGGGEAIKTNLNYQQWRKQFGYNGRSHSRKLIKGWKFTIYSRTQLQVRDFQNKFSGALENHCSVHYHFDDQLSAIIAKIAHYKYVWFIASCIAEVVRGYFCLSRHRRFRRLWAWQHDT